MNTLNKLNCILSFKVYHIPVALVIEMIAFCITTWIVYG